MKRNAYETGRAESGTRRDRIRRYQSDKAERDYWRGYTDVIIESIPADTLVVQCERDGLIFTAPVDATAITCKGCGRGYLREADGSFESDRKLTIIHPKK
jgi:hypothetical protein